MGSQTNTPAGSPRYNAKLFGLLLIPSWLSGIIAVVAGLVVSLVVIVLSRFRGSDLHLYFVNYQASHNNLADKVTNSSLLTNPIINNLPLLLFWAVVGLIVYSFASNVFRAFKQTEELREELDYVNVDRRQLLLEVAKRVFIRLVVLLVWLPYILWFIHHLLPYVVATALAASAQLASLNGIGLAALAVLVLAVATHLHTVLLRLVFLKPRLFSSALYVDQHRL